MEARGHDVLTGVGAGDSRTDVASLLAGMDTRLQLLQQEFQSVTALMTDDAPQQGRKHEPHANTAADTTSGPSIRRWVTGEDLRGASPGQPEPAIERRVGGPGAAMRRPRMQSPAARPAVPNSASDAVIQMLVREAEREAQQVVDDARQRIAQIGVRTRGLVQRSLGAAPESVNETGPEPRSEQTMTPEWRAYEGAVTVEAGPFTDIEQLKGFEDALASVPGVEDVEIRTLERDSALFDVFVSVPTALIVELRQRASDALHVTDTADSSVRVTIVRRGIERVAS
jgi:hypothetical protein